MVKHDNRRFVFQTKVEIYWVGLPKVGWRDTTNRKGWNLPFEFHILNNIQQPTQVKKVTL